MQESTREAEPGWVTFVSGRQRFLRGMKDDWLWLAMTFNQFGSQQGQNSLSALTYFECCSSNRLSSVDLF